MKSISDLVYDLIYDQTGLIVPKDALQNSYDDTFFILKLHDKIILKIETEFEKNKIIFDIRDIKNKISDHIN